MWGLGRTVMWSRQNCRFLSIRNLWRCWHEYTIIIWILIKNQKVVLSRKKLVYVASVYNAIKTEKLFMYSYLILLTLEWSHALIYQFVTFQKFDHMNQENDDVNQLLQTEIPLVNRWVCVLFAPPQTETGFHFNKVLSKKLAGLKIKYFTYPIWIQPVHLLLGCKKPQNTQTVSNYLIQQQ